MLARRAYDFGATPETVAVMRLALPAAVFVPWAVFLVLRSRSFRGLGPRTAALAGTYGLILLAINVFELTALDRIPVAIVILIIALMPLWISIFSWVLWRVPLGKRGLVALVAAFAGTALIVGNPSGRLDLPGVAISVAASVMSAGLYLLLERGLHSPPPQLVLAVGAAVGTVGALALQPHAFSSEFGNGTERAALVLGAGLAVSATMLLTLIGIRNSSAFVAGVAVACEPVFAGILAWLILDETLSSLPAGRRGRGAGGSGGSPLSPGYRRPTGVLLTVNHR